MKIAIDHFSKRFLYGLAIYIIVQTSHASSDVTMVPVISYLLQPDEVPQLIEHRYPKNEGPDKNPLKGWNSAWWNRDRDETSVGFQYIPWRLFETSNGDFSAAVDAVEAIVSRDGSQGRHLILRIYCDWAGLHDISNPNTQWQGRSNGCPEWMYEEVGVTHIVGMDRGVTAQDGSPLLPTVTDYNNNQYLEQAEQIIAEFARLYNNDPRIFVIQFGILGYWGEWHTFGSNLDPEFAEEQGYEIDRYNRSYIISDQAKRRIIDAFKNGFTNKRLVGRYPDDDILSRENTIGFHNDFFMPFSDHSADFDDEIEANQFWQNGPIGGEAPPEFNEGSGNGIAVFTTNRGLEMIEKARYTTMLLDKPSNPAQLAGYMNLHRKMGYNFQIEKAVFATQLSRDSELALSLFINNIGVAPIYYSWNLEFALLDNNNNVVVAADALNYDLQDIMPTNMTRIDGRINVSSLSAGNYRVGVRIVQPGSQANKPQPWKLLARNTYIEFSNDLETIDGTWDVNNALVGGWSILGGIRID